MPLLNPLYLVIILYFALFLPLIGLSEVFQVSEAREGFVIFEILQNKEWILPLRNGVSIPSKPPLFHWIGAALTIDRIDEFSLRLPSFLASMGLLIIVGRYAQRRGGNSAGAIASAILVSMYGFLRLAADGRVDMLFCFLTTWSCLTAFEIIESGSHISKKQFILFSLLSGLSVLAKGPLGVALPTLTLCCGWWAMHGWRTIRTLLRPELLIIPGVSLPWYLAAYTRGQTAFVERQIVFENIQRFFGGDGVNEKGGLFYIPHLLGQGAPWSIIFCLYLYFVGREALKRRGKNRFIPIENRAAILLNLLMFGLVVVILTLSAGKRRSYLLLCLPNIALILALRFASTYERMKREGKLILLENRFRYETLTWGMLLWFVGVIPGLIPIFIKSKDAVLLDPIIPGASRLFSDLEAALIRGGDVLCGDFLFLSLGSLFLWILGHKKQKISYLSGAIVLYILLFLMVYVQTWLTMKGHSHSYKQFALRLATTVPDSLEISIIKTPKDESFDGLFFYLQRHMRIQSPEKVPTAPGLYLARREWLDAHPEVHGTKIFDGGRRVDKPGKELVLFRVH